MAYKIKLRRDWQGQDSWGAFIEEVAINDEDGTLAYRRTEGGNCCYGGYEFWEDEDRTLKFILGPVKVTGLLRASLFVALSKLADISELTAEQLNSGGASDTINYGSY